MTLIFENIKKKISRKKYLEIDIEFLKGNKLLIVDEDKSNLAKISSLFQNNSKYEGNIYLFDNNIKNEKEYFYFSDENYGFYNYLTVYQNFYRLLKLFKISLKKEEIMKFLEIAKIENIKYNNLDTNSQKRCKLLFKYLISEDLFLVDLYKYEDFLQYEEFYKFIINNNYYKNRIVVLLSENINKIVESCDKVLVMSENKQVYYGDIQTLNVIRDLIIIEISNFTENQLELEFDFKVIDNKIVVRKADMENVLYYFVKNNIQVLSINDFNENTNIYNDKE